MTQPLDHRLTVALRVARAAGELGLRHFRSLELLSIESKGHQDLVSNADREVELFVRAEFAKEFPEDGIVGEEHAPATGTSGHVWVIDPIDGTANFVRGIPAWCVVIACVHDGVTELGVIHEPSTGETFSATRGGGAHLNGCLISASSAVSLTEGSVGTGSSNRKPLQHVVDLIALLSAEGGVFFRNASGALMLAYVASGRLLGYCEEHMNAWDCLAGLLMIEEAGGRIVPPAPDVVAEGTLVIAGGAAIFPKLLALCEQAYRLKYPTRPFTRRPASPPRPSSHTAA
jgi:myo-inositol-1(or 4)-monophosphatase